MSELPKYVFIDDTTIVRTSAENLIRSEMGTGGGR